MRIYISGKMTGLPDLGRAHFANTERALRESGHIVLNPGVLPLGMPKSAYMPICLAMLDAADAIYMLGGWDDSPGAHLEMLYAQYQGKRVYHELDMADRLELFDYQRPPVEPGATQGAGRDAGC